MVKHIVMWRLQSEALGKSKTENMQELKKMLEALPALIPEIVSLEVGLNFCVSETAADVVLVSVFAGEKELEIYQKHPEHVKVGAFVKAVSNERRVVDFF